MEVEKIDFLESAQILVPALSGMAVTSYTFSSDILVQFEKKNCFSTDLQTIYTKEGMETFLEHASEDKVYEVIEPLDTRTMIFKADGAWILLGPYVENEWNPKNARSLLAKQNVSESLMLSYKGYRCQFPIINRDYAVNLAFLMTCDLDGDRKRVETLIIDPIRQKESLRFSDVYANASMINRRYQMEDRFMNFIEQGEYEKACWSLKELEKVLADIRFISNSFQDQLAGAAIMRTLIRIAAKRGGLSPVLVDSISQEYAQKMRYAVSKKELDRLTGELLERFCREIKQRKQVVYSVVIRQAMDYIEINLGKNMTIIEIAEAVGREKCSFVRQFRQETGLTIKEYIAKKRCSLAAELLLDTHVSVQEIASYVGYQDNNYFSKVFKNERGVSPLEYRNNHKNIKNSIF